MAFDVPDSPLFQRGIRARREVMGDAFVDRALNNVDDFNRELQRLVTELAWGECWADDTISRRERSILNIGMIAALGRMHEFEGHVRGALRNGITEQELIALLKQVTMYCGFPAGIEAHRVAKKVLDEEKAAQAAQAAGN